MEIEFAQLHVFSILHPLLSQLSWTPSEVTGEEERGPFLHSELTVGEHELVGQSSCCLCQQSLCRSIREGQGGCAKSGSDHTADTPRMLCSGLSAPLEGGWDSRLDEEWWWWLRVEKHTLHPLGFLADIHYSNPRERKKEFISFSIWEGLRKEESSVCLTEI